jgi:D-alanine-D-alanine ligase
MKQRIAVLYGGKSGEHQVSKESAASVIRNFDRDRFDLFLIGIDESGQWHLQDEEMLEMVLSGQPLDIGPGRRVIAYPGVGLAISDGPLAIDLVFPVLHGTNGEDGTIQGFLEILGIPYSGSDILTSALGMDKIRAKEMWRNEGIQVVPFASYDRGEYRADSDGRENAEALYRRWSAELGVPFFVKPCRAGSSVGISKVKKASDLSAALEAAFQFDHRLLIERAVDAREIECSVLGYRDVESFPPGEVISHHEFYDYSGKYLDPDGASLEYPANLPDEISERIRSMAVKAFMAIGGDGLARVDFFLERESGEVFINEINTMPGFTAISMYPKMCESGGLAYRDLLTRMVELGLGRHARQSALNLHYGD